MNSSTLDRIHSIKLYDDDPPVKCYILHIIGVYLVILFLSSVMLNTLNLWVYYKKKLLQTPIYCFMAALICLNLIGTLLQLPVVIYSAFNCKFIFGKYGCITIGFIMYFIGCMSIYLLVAISIERHIVLNNLRHLRFISFKACMLMIVICALLSGFWAAMPLVGWSYYSLEGAKISCSVEWHERTTNVTSYNVTMFVFVFIMPLILIIFTNTKIIIKIRKTRSELKKSISMDRKSRQRILRQNMVTKITTMLMIFFLISWTPYAIISMYVAFIDEKSVGPLLATIPALFAKSSLLWPAFLNILFNNDFKD